MPRVSGIARDVVFAQVNFSSVKGVGGGVFESRIDFGPGLRVYFGKDGATVVILLGGGSKQRQPRAHPVYRPRQISPGSLYSKTHEGEGALNARHCVEVRQVGSHLRVECGACASTIPVHAGQDLGPGLLRAIERDLEPCLGKGWLRRS